MSMEQGTWDGTWDGTWAAVPPRAQSPEKERERHKSVGGRIGRSHRTCSLGQSNGPSRGVDAARPRSLCSPCFPPSPPLLQPAERNANGRYTADEPVSLSMTRQENCGRVGMVAATWLDQVFWKSRRSQSGSRRHANSTPRQRVDAM